MPDDRALRRWKSPLRGQPAKVVDEAREIILGEREQFDFTTPEVLQILRDPADRLKLEVACRQINDHALRIKIADWLRGLANELERAKRRSESWIPFMGYPTAVGGTALVAGTIAMFTLGAAVLPVAAAGATVMIAGGGGMTLLRRRADDHLADADEARRFADLLDKMKP